MPHNRARQQKMTLDLLNNFLSNLPEGFIGNNTHADLIQQLAGQADAKANEYKATTSAETEAATQDEKELVQIACNELQSKQDEIDGVEEQIRELFATLALKKLELEELAQSVVETNNDYKAALSTIKNEQVKVFNTIRAEQDIVATFLKTAEIITDNVDKSFAGEYVDIQTVLIDTLETLKQAGFDLDDDATHAALFALDLHDSAELEIKSKGWFLVDKNLEQQFMIPSNKLVRVFCRSIIYDDPEDNYSVSVHENGQWIGNYMFEELKTENNSKIVTDYKKIKDKNLSKTRSFYLNIPVGKSNYSYYTFSLPKDSNKNDKVLIKIVEYEKSKN